MDSKWNLPSFTGLYLVLPSFIGHEWVSQSFTELSRLLPSFTGFKMESTDF